MTDPQSFSSGLVQAPFVTSSGLLPKVWRVISSRDEGIVSYSGNGLIWKVYVGSDFTVVAFEVNPDFDLQPDSVSSSDPMKEKDFHRFQFLCSKKNPDFAVNESALELFSENLERLDELKPTINSSTPLIVTGHGLGGSVASLFTISLLDSRGSGKNRPLCITYGSPLIGDKRLQQAISRSSNWNSCFLHVVSLKDPLPRLFITNCSSSAASLTPQTSVYMPFGTFFLCSDANSTCFENPDTILELLIATGSIHAQNQGFQSTDYGNIVENLYDKVIFKDSGTWVENMTHPNSVLACSISLQLQALGLVPHMQQQQQNIDINTLETKIKNQEEKFIFQPRRALRDPSKKLNQVKEHMAQLEWYKKKMKNEEIGYYDSYKKMNSPWDHDVNEFHKKLTIYWEDMVEEAEMKPQKEGAAFRTRWLYAGTNYRRMVEPLDIADYYPSGRKDYVANGRSRHYKVLEEWLKEGKKDKNDANNTSRKNVELILTIDSCFWAKVEEALLQLENVNEKEEAKGKLREFEDYVYGSLKKYEVSPEIFLKKSSYMTWWNQYKEISHNPGLASFMSNPHHYDQYTKGDYVFP